MEEIRHTPLLTIWLGPAFAARTRRLRDSTITSAGMLSPVIYNCRTRNIRDPQEIIDLLCTIRIQLSTALEENIS